LLRTAGRADVPGSGSWQPWDDSSNSNRSYQLASGARLATPQWFLGGNALDARTRLMLAVVENIIDGRLNAQYHDLEGSARQETNPRHRAIGRSQAIKAIASGFFAKHPGHPASELEALFCLMCTTSFLFNI